MRMFNSLLASVGVGAAQVDTRVRTIVLIPGELIHGHVYIRGGEVAQTIDGITLSIATQCTRAVDDATWSEMYVLATHDVTGTFTIGPQERNVLPFAFPLPYETPLTLGRQRIYLRTNLGIARALDARDADRLAIRPHPLQQQVLDALAALHVRLTGVDCIYEPLPGHIHPIVQELAFLPTSVYRRDIEELEVVFRLSERGLDVLIEIERRARGFGRQIETAYALSERYARIHVPHTGLDQQEVVGLIEQAIHATVRKHHSGANP